MRLHAQRCWREKLSRGSSLPTPLIPHSCSLPSQVMITFARADKPLDSAAAEAVAKASASLATWMAHNASGTAVTWTAGSDLGALLHGFLVRFGTLFDCSQQAISLAKVRACDACGATAATRCVCPLVSLISAAAVICCTACWCALACGLQP